MELNRVRKLNCAVLVIEFCRFNTCYFYNPKLIFNIYKLTITLNFNLQ